MDVKKLYCVGAMYLVKEQYHFNDLCKFNYLTADGLLSMTTLDGVELYIQPHEVFNEVVLAEEHKELKQKYEKLREFHENAMKMWVKESPPMPVPGQSGCIVGGYIDSNVVEFQFDTHGAVNGIRIGAKAKIVIEDN